MPTREELHSLVHSLPEGALEAAHRALSHLQVWPPVPPPDVQEWRQRAQQKWAERRQEFAQRQKPGTLSVFGGGSRYDSERGVGSASFNHWEGDTFVVETLRRHKGHEFTVIERIRIDGSRLTYKHEILAGDKRDEREIVFDV
jgi:hypothetical protein